VRTAWRRLAFGFGAFAFGDVAWCLIEVAFDGSPFPSIADLSYLAFYPLVLWGLLSFPMALRTRHDRVKLWLDALIVVVGAGAAIWYFVFLPVLRQAQAAPLAAAAALAYPVGDLLLLLGLATVLLRRPDRGTAAALRTLAVGLALLVVSDIAFGPQFLQDAYEGGGWVDILWTLAGLLLAIGSQVQTWRAGHRAPGDVGGAVDGAALSPVPYVAVAVGQCLLVVAALDTWQQALGGLIAASILVTVLVVSRQIVAVRENGRLLAAHAARREAVLQLASRFGARAVPSALEAEVLRAAIDLVGGDHAVISAWDADRAGLDVTHRLHARMPAGVDAALAEVGHVAALRGEPVLHAPSTGSGDGMAVVAVPIAYDGHLYGVVALGTTGASARYSDDDAEILALLAGIAAATILGGERARLEGALLAARTAEHELNNQLTAAAGFAELLATDEALPEHLRGLAEASLTGALEAARLVGEIRQIRRVVLKDGPGSVAPDGNVIDLRHSAA
jgi:GAF domain-containing protein